MHGSKRWVGSGKAAAWSRKKRWPIDSACPAAVRSRSFRQQARRWALSSARSATLGTVRGPAPLEVEDSVLGDGLLVAGSRQAKERLEGIVAGQGGIALVGLALPAFEGDADNGGGIVPPHLARHGLEELEGLDHAAQDGLRPLGGHGHDQGAVRERPRCHEDRDLLAPLGEVHIDVAEVALQPSAGIVRQRNERLALTTAMLTHVAAHLIVAAEVAVFAVQPSVNLSRSVPLFGWSRLVSLKYLVNDRVKRPQLGRGRILAARVGLRLGAGQGLPNLAPRVVKHPGQGPNAQAVMVSTSNPTVIVHRKHPAPPDAPACSQTDQHPKA